MDHPYKIYESCLLWEVIQKALNETNSNNDIIFNTPKERVCNWFICMQIDKKNY